MSLTLSLFDTQAVVLHKKLEDMHVDPKVIVATNINPKMVGGTILLYPYDVIWYYGDHIM